MKYDFTTVLNRKGLDALAVDEPGSTIHSPEGPSKEGFDLIPMWVADMNFHYPACTASCLRLFFSPAGIL